MKRETYDILVSQFDSDPVKWYEVFKALLLEMVNESEQRSERRKNAPKKQGSTKKKISETSETTTHTTSEVKEKSDFDKAIDGFVEMRKKIKKPLTEQWLKLIKEKLEKLYPWKQDLQIKVLNNSISNSRQWVFPLKEEEEQKPKSKYNPFEDLSDLPLI